MAITTLSSLRSAMERAQRQPIYKASFAAANNRFSAIYDYWGSQGLPTNGSTSAVGNNGVTLDRASQGAVPFTPAGAGNTLYLLSANLQTLWDTRGTTMPILMTSGMVHVWDRLWYNDSISANSTARRSWTPPALTRYTSGEGVYIWYKQTSNGTGTGTVTYTIEYTSSDGVAQTHAYTWNHGGLSQIALANQLVPVPLVLGDKGVREVTAITQSTTLASGNYGFILQKYVGCFPVTLVSSYPAPTSIFCGMPAIHNDAHLTFGVQMGPPYDSAAFVASTSPTFGGELLFVEG